jgi:AraC-like DNA-binding protein
MLTQMAKRSFLTELDTRHVVPQDRFAYWLEAFSRAVVPLDVRSDLTCDFAANMRALDLGVLRVAAHRYPCLEVNRTPHLASRGEPGPYQLLLNLRGEVEAVQSHRTVRLDPGEFTLLDCALPFHASHTLGRRKSGQPQAITMAIVRHLLPVPVDRAECLIASRISGQEGVGVLLRQYLRELIRHPQRYQPHDLARLGTVTLDLVAATLACHLDSDPATAPVQAMLASVHTFIDRHLADPDLSPHMIAVAHHISTRTLHRLFDSGGTTIARWIRSRRLQRCRHDLADSLQRGHSIHAISARWGFRDGAHFSRAFRAEYGMSPKAFRERQTATEPYLTRIANGMAPAGDDIVGDEEKR